LHDSGPAKVHNIDNLLLRESMDVIGARLQLIILGLVLWVWGRDLDISLR
jgi:hypothetical protein